MESEEYKAFCYYSDRILAAMNPHNSKYKQQKAKVELSKMLTVHDEAYALIMLYNEFDVWMDLYTTGNKRK